MAAFPFSGPSERGGWARIAATAGAVASAYLAVRRLSARTAIPAGMPVSEGDTNSQRWWPRSQMWSFGKEAAVVGGDVAGTKRAKGARKGAKAGPMPPTSSSSPTHRAPMPNSHRADTPSPSSKPKGGAEVAPSDAPDRLGDQGDAGTTLLVEPRRHDGSPEWSQASSPPRPPKPARWPQVGMLVLHGHIAKAVAQLDGASIGDDPEFIHKLRTSSRRARVTAAIWRRALAGPFGARDVRRVMIALRTIGRAAGPVRDLDVWITSLPAIAKREAPNVDVTPLVHLAREQNVVAQAAFRTMLPDPEVIWLRHTFLPRLAAQCAHLHEGDEAVKIALRAGWREPVVSAIAAMDELGAPLTDWVQRRAAVLRDHGADALRTLPFVDEVLAHDVRLRAKGARYAAEIFQTCWEAPSARDEMAGAVASYTAIQEALGDWHDHIVWHERIVEGAEELALRGADTEVTESGSRPLATVRSLSEIAQFLRLSAHIRQSQIRTLDAVAATWEARLEPRALVKGMRAATQ